MKNKSQYSCQGCGYVNAKWLGRCPDCGAWNTFVEERAPQVTEGALTKDLAGLREHLKREVSLGPVADKRWTRLSETQSSGVPPVERVNTGIQELNRVLGGGLVPDSFVLLGGDPGIGKSTLLLQMADGITRANSDFSLLYVSGEESVEQIKMRARRLGVHAEERIYLAAETQLERVFDLVSEIKPRALVIDSLQTFSSGALESGPGSVSQLREVTARLMMLAKTSGVNVWLVGHVTKDGNIAGPKMVEHMVDTVLYFEGEGGHHYRMLRAVKNRFGSTRELGVFEMVGEGLMEVSNPSALFLSERERPVEGVTVTSLLEGTRPFLVELQALVVGSTLAMPRRTTVGLDSAKLSLLTAILERKLQLNLSQADVFFNVSGGLRVSEPASDLAAAAAIWSSAKKIAVPGSVAWVGEVALTGEVRRAGHLEVRAREAAKLGFKTLVVPKVEWSRDQKAILDLPLKFLPIEHIADLNGLAGKW